MSKIPIFQPNESGHQFVIYGDSCSGVPNALHESTFGQVNAVIQRLETQPQFICYPGDEIMGLTTDADELRRQWIYWFEHEMAWLDRESIPMYHTTGNHTTYDPMSEEIFREVMAHLPKNGPDDQQGLSYFVRRDDLLMVFIHTLWSGLGGEGNVETEWLEQTLQEHSDAKHKLVLGHHPVFTVNGFFADYQRNIEAQNGRRLWDILVKHEVLAYVCSHILAFDVQVHEGVLQICTAGSGTAHRMPEGIEYLHALQVALDDKGLRYQVLNTKGAVREWLTWDWDIPASDTWEAFDSTRAKTLSADCLQIVDEAHLIIWEISGQLDTQGDYSRQTLLNAVNADDGLPNLWLGIGGQDHHLMLSLSPQPNRSPHGWYGPSLPTDKPFSIQFAIHSGMGPGGFLWRWDDTQAWSTLTGTSSWGAERITWSQEWLIDDADPSQPFCGNDLNIIWHHQIFALKDYLT
jgi:hypothetical protein